MEDGEIIHLQGFGDAASSGRAVRPQTPNYLASVTKSFTRAGGDNGNFRSMVILMPDRRSGLLLLANATGYEGVHQIPSAALGILNLLNGDPPAPVPSPPFDPRFLHWVIPVTLLLQIFGIVIAWQNRQHILGGDFLLTVVFNLSAILLLIGLSQLIPFPFPSMLGFFPEVD